MVKSRHGWRKWKLIIGVRKWDLVVVEQKKKKRRTGVPGEGAEANYIWSPQALAGKDGASLTLGINGNRCWADGSASSAVISGERFSKLTLQKLRPLRVTSTRASDALSFSRRHVRSRRLQAPSQVSGSGCCLSWVRRRPPNGVIFRRKSLSVSRWGCFITEMLLPPHPFIRSLTRTSVVKRGGGERGLSLFQRWILQPVEYTISHSCHVTWFSVRDLESLDVFFFFCSIPFLCSRYDVWKKGEKTQNHIPSGNGLLDSLSCWSSEGSRSACDYQEKITRFFCLVFFVLLSISILSIC